MSEGIVGPIAPGCGCWDPNFLSVNAPCLPQTIEWLGVMPSAYLMSSVPPESGSGVWFLDKIQEKKSQGFSKVINSTSLFGENCCCQEKSP